MSDHQRFPHSAVGRSRVPAADISTLQWFTPSIPPCTPPPSVTSVTISEIRSDRAFANDDGRAEDGGRKAEGAKVGR
jgi:hypothetical protein